MKTKDGKELHSTNDLLTSRYGERGTEKRQDFQEKAMAWYYGELLRDKRKELRMTQKELADKMGRKQSYIARVERGDTDIQLSSFIRIVETLGFNLSLTEKELAHNI